MGPDLDRAGKFEMRAGKVFSEEMFELRLQAKKKAWEINCYLSLVKCSIKKAYFVQENKSDRPTILVKCHEV